MSTSDISESEVDVLYKVLVIGEGGVGKTSLIKQYPDGLFSGSYRHTYALQTKRKSFFFHFCFLISSFLIFLNSIGVDFSMKTIEWDSKTMVRLQLWDIAGQERFGVMTHVYYKEAAAAICVFSLIYRESFEAISRWKQDLDAKVKQPSGKPIPAFLVGNKSDLVDPRKPLVSEEEIIECTRSLGFAGWFQTSAKENTNIDAVMQFLISTVITQDENLSMPARKNTILLNPHSHPSSGPSLRAAPPDHRKPPKEDKCFCA
ncbi:MAG: ras-related protein Rab [archaeon]|nr:ras-related protein Rab [archaeon]